MFAKVLAALVATAAIGVGGATLYTSFSGGSTCGSCAKSAPVSDCCSAQTECCAEQAACCPSASAQAADCCDLGLDCCNIGLDCCKTEVKTVSIIE